MNHKILELIRNLEESIEFYLTDRKSKNLPEDSLYAVRIMINLILLALEENRAITKEEEKWFSGSYYLAQSFDGTEYEEIYKYYQKLVDQVRLQNYFRK
jgi:hypothetical protein